jgi:hypothetical protein
MPVATLEHSSKDRAPVFVSGGHRRARAVRVAASALGVLLAGWLVALAAGLVGFTPLPELALPGTGATRAAPALPERASETGAEHSANPPASRLVRSASSGGATSSAGDGSAQNASDGRTGAGAAQTGGARDGASSTAPSSGAGSARPQPTTPSPGTAGQTGSGSPPAFTPPASGKKSANPPRGNSANAPGRTVSADPPGKATRTHSG